MSPEESAPRQRAPRQSVEQRRAMVVQAAIPLLVEVGPAVTTLQIARAAGISEPTIFRAFADKNEVLAACLAEVTDPRHVEAELAAIEADLPLRERLAALIEVVRAQGERTGAVVSAVCVAGATRFRAPGAPTRESISEEERNRLSAGRNASYARLHAAIAGVLEPDAARLRMPVADIATLVLSIVLALGHHGGWGTGAGEIRTDQLVALILHGIVGVSQVTAAAASVGL